MIDYCKVASSSFSFSNTSFKDFETVFKVEIWCLCTGKSFSEALILESFNPQYDNRLFIDFRLQYKKNTCSEHVVYKNWFFVFVLAFKTILVHNMSWTCIFFALKSGINEQSVVILWVNWLKNKCFWHKFTCTVTFGQNNQWSDSIKSIICSNQWFNQTMIQSNQWFYQIHDSIKSMIQSNQWFNQINDSIKQWFNQINNSIKQRFNQINDSINHWFNQINN